jgi:DNA (cytosine-5)-methyltransferase 1
VRFQLAFSFGETVPRREQSVNGRSTDRSASKGPVAADLFCGAGGLSFGFMLAGFNVAFGNDVNQDCYRTYDLNHPGTQFFPCSIEDLTTEEVLRTTGIGKADVDVLIGGPPCQGFSINAPKRSLEDDRNNCQEVRKHMPSR